MLEVLEEQGKDYTTAPSGTRSRITTRIYTAQRVDVQRETRSGARELAAEMAYRFVVKNGFWINLADAGIEPKLEDAINQLQELYQKKYVDAAPQYEIEEQAHFDSVDPWYCSCSCGGVEGWGRAPVKVKAKKRRCSWFL